MIKKRFIMAVMFALAAVPACKAANAKAIKLEQCEQDALAQSETLKKLKAQEAAAAANTNAAAAYYYPRISLNAQGSWVSEVPELKTGAASIKYGDNWNYSIGPSAEYQLYNKERRHSEAAAKKILDSKRQEIAFAEKQIILQTRKAYFRLQQNLQRLYLLSGQLKVARQQHAEIKASLAAGTKTRLDELMAKKQVNSAKALMSEARVNLSAALHEIFRLTSNDYGINPAYPLDFRLKGLDAESEATDLIEADSIEKTLSIMSQAASKEFDSESPRLAAMESMKGYYEYLAEQYRSALQPKLTLSAGAYLQYPNGPIRESVFIGKAGASFSLPLFEGGRNSSQAKAKKYEAVAASHDKQEARQNLLLLFKISKDSLHGLSNEEKILKVMINDAEEEAKLAYEAYKAGSVTFLETDNANLRLLESRMALSDLEIRKLNSLATIDSLGK
ncbi:MAG: TolC family protein [Elusimicrobiales bacterium]|nr:TolC family protein [Elusimicrobiales bacterium]